MPNILVVGRGETKYVRDKFWASSNEDVFTFCREITSKWLCLSEPQFFCPQRCALPALWGCWVTQMRKPRWVCLQKSGRPRKYGALSFLWGETQSRNETHASERQVKYQKRIPKKMRRSGAERPEAGFQFVIVSFTDFPPPCSLVSFSVKWRSKCLHLGPFWDHNNQYEPGLDPHSVKGSSVSFTMPHGSCKG